ncbi:hypothetical protein DRN45_02950, partial [Thermococci archaeon]
MGSRKVIYLIVIFLLVISIVYIPGFVGEEENEICIHKGCNEPIWEGSDEYCIFHDPDPNKDKVLLEQKLKEKIENKDYNFSGFIFPENISFPDMIFEKKVNFTNAVFYGKIDFSGITLIDADFSNAVFEEAVHFNDLNCTD